MLGYINEPGSTIEVTTDSTTNWTQARRTYVSPTQAWFEVSGLSVTQAGGGNTISVRAVDVAGNAATSDVDVTASSANQDYAYDADGNQISGAMGTCVWSERGASGSDLNYQLSG